MQVKVVMDGRETDMDLKSLSPEATDSEILKAVAGRAERDMNDYHVTREGSNVLVSPTPVFG